MSNLTKLADRLDAVAHKIAKKKRSKSKSGCRYTKDTSGRWKWVCGPGGQPGDSETHSSQGNPGGSPDSGGAGAGDASGGDGGTGGGAGGAGGAGGGGGGGGA